MTLKVKVYSGSKYDERSGKVAEVIYDDVASMKVEVIEDDVIYSMGFDEVDEYKEYAILTFSNGETSTFKNSEVDIFRV